MWCQLQAELETMAMTSGSPEAALDVEIQHMYDVARFNLEASKTSTLNHVKNALIHCNRVRARLMMPLNKGLSIGTPSGTHDT